MNQKLVPEQNIKREFDNSTEKFQIITAWVGIVLNLAWFISDYFIIRDFLIPFFTFRLLVSGTVALLLLLRKPLKLTVLTCLFTLVIGISIQNAYMWSVMDLSHFQKHAFAYMVLFIGVGMLVLWELKFSLILVVTTLLANLIFYKLYSQLSSAEFLINGGLITFTVIIFCVFMIRTRYRLTYNEIRIRLELELSKKNVEQKHEQVLEQKKEIQDQKDTLEEKNREITDSIHYAKSIQNALLSSEDKFKSHFNDSFVFFQPKDIVSGDFYWIYPVNDLVFYVTADCTGHGVPGGFMTMLGLSFLDQIITFQHIHNPAEVLNLMRDKIIAALNQSGNAIENKDGMDITVCVLNTKNKELVYSAANNNLYVIRNNSPETNNKEFFVFKGNRQPCGFSHHNKPFSEHKIALNKGDCVYTFTDGFADQFGGPKGKKFRYKQFEEVLLKNSHLTCSEQKEQLRKASTNWRGSLEQVDDMLIIGIRV
ncbi:MAG: SpoIIE family protein phosphatase [bacterium]|nr:SpoIIE family protein phosphatase [bacterium]